MTETKEIEQLELSNSMEVDKAKPRKDLIGDIFIISTEFYPLILKLTQPLNTLVSVLKTPGQID